MLNRVRLVIVIAGIMAIGSATAAGDPVAERRALMRDMHKAERAANNNILGNFRPDKVAAAMQTIQAGMVTFVELFPPGSESGGETKADPSIWSEMDNLRALATRTAADAKAAEAAIANGQNAFATAWQVVAEDCTSCHDKYAPTMMIR